MQKRWNADKSQLRAFDRPKISSFAPTLSSRSLWTFPSNGFQMVPSPATAGRLRGLQKRVCGFRTL